MCPSKKIDEFSLDVLARIDEDPLLAESDRGCVLILSTDIENSLKELLTYFIVASSSSTKKQQKDLFDYTGPLGTFSSKIKLSNAVGLISLDIYSDLEKLREVRNIAAHSDSAFTLSSDKITKIINALNYNHSKLETFGKYPRHSIINQDKDDSEFQPQNETILKGQGILRHDKVNFIMTAKLLLFEINKLQVFAKMVGKEIQNKRNEFISILNKKIAKI